MTAPGQLATGTVNGHPSVAAATPTTLAKALNMGLRAGMENDPKVLIMGEDVGKLGGVFRVTDGLQKDFGEHRVLDTPLAESGIIGTAIGLAMRGYRPVTEIQFDGFVFPGFDQIISQLAKIDVPHPGPRQDAGGRPDPLRRRDRRGRAPRGGARVVLLPHRRPAGGDLLERRGRLFHDPGGDQPATTRSCSSSRNAGTGRRRRWTSRPHRAPLSPPSSVVRGPTSPWSPTGRRCRYCTPQPRQPPPRDDRWS